MTPNDIDLVQASFAKVEPIAGEAGQMFYSRLFEIAPEVRPFFTGDMTEQAAKLMTTLGFVVRGLTTLETVVPVAQKLAVAHVDYGVKAEHYAPVGAALLDTLSTGLGDDFTDETRAAWETAYGTLSSVMITAAYGETVQ